MDALPGTARNVLQLLYLSPNDTFQQMADGLETPEPQSDGTETFKLHRDEEEASELCREGKAVRKFVHFPV